MTEKPIPRRCSVPSGTDAPTCIVAALARAQANFTTVVKSKTNPHFKSKYADLGDVNAAVIPALNAEGIAVTQPIEAGMLVTRLRLGAESIESSVPVNLDVKPQELGSQLTYLRRYCLSALVCVASEDDDDGHAASSARPRRERSAEPDPDATTASEREEVRALLRAQSETVRALMREWCAEQGIEMRSGDITKETLARVREQLVVFETVEPFGLDDDVVDVPSAPVDAVESPSSDTGGSDDRAHMASGEAAATSTASGPVPPRNRR